MWIDVIGGNGENLCPVCEGWVPSERWEDHKKGHLSLWERVKEWVRKDWGRGV